MNCPWPKCDRPCSRSTIDRQIEETQCPSPWGLVVKNASNIPARFAESSPVPVSETDTLSSAIYQFGGDAQYSRNVECRFHRFGMAFLNKLRITC